MGCSDSFDPIIYVQFKQQDGQEICNYKHVHIDESTVHFQITRGSNTELVIWEVVKSEEMVVLLLVGRKKTLSYQKLLKL